jgi:tRNA pseudouridine38-40 synthase
VQELLEVSLSAPGRVSLPRAPPHSLLLYGSQFSNFPAGWGLDTPLVARFTGAKLELRQGGQAMRQAFRQRVFDAAINDLLQHPDWEQWSTRMLPRYTYAAADVAPVVQAHAVWLADLLAKRAAAAAKKAEAAEAAAAAAAEAEAEAAGKAPGVLQAVFGAVLRLFGAK